MNLSDLSRQACAQTARLESFFPNTTANLRSTSVVSRIGLSPTSAPRRGALMHLTSRLTVPFPALRQKRRLDHPIGRIEALLKSPQPRRAPTAPSMFENVWNSKPVGQAQTAKLTQIETSIYKAPNRHVDTDSIAFKRAIDAKLDKLETDKVLTGDSLAITTQRLQQQFPDRKDHQSSQSLRGNPPPIQ